MNELIRLYHVGKSCKDGQILSDYNVCIFQGEILYIQDNHRLGKEYLRKILTGREQIDEGMIYYKGEKLSGRKAVQVLEKACFAIGNQMPVIDEMSISENLSALKPVFFPFRRWDENNAAEVTSEILQSIDIHRKPQTKGKYLTQEEKIRLCIAKAAMTGVELIILNDLTSIYREQEIRELHQLMRHYCRKGISFLILANKRNAFYEAASRVQIMQGGRDLMEWQEQAEAVEQTAVSHICQSKPEALECAGRIIYIIDRAWKGPAYGKEYLRVFKENNPEIWFQEERLMKRREGGGRRQSFLRKGNPMFDGEMAWIPYNSAEMLLENMPLEDNISVCIPKQTEKCGALHENARKLLKREFLDRVHRRSEVDSIQEISIWERKALSIFRWELAVPKALLIDAPFAELNFSETRLLDSYLGDVRKRKIELIIFLPEWIPCIENYDLILTASAGKDGRVKK